MRERQLSNSDRADLADVRAASQQRRRRPANVGFSPQAQANACRKSAVRGHWAYPGTGDPATSDREYSADELEFLRAVDVYKTAARRPFPTLAELLAVIKGLGYRKP